MILIQKFLFLLFLFFHSFQSFQLNLKSDITNNYLKKLYRPNKNNYNYPSYWQSENSENEDWLNQRAQPNPTTHTFASDQFSI